MNAINTEAYKKWREKYNELFVPEYRDPECDYEEEFENGFAVRSQAYIKKNGYYVTDASEEQFFNKENEICYSWRNLNGIKANSLFRHSNGRLYLIFHIDLYGYSVLDIESKEVFHYVPSESRPENTEDFDETFIWCETYYDPQSNLLAVEGCFWACPYSVIVVDFSDPMKEQPTERWFDIAEFFGKDFCEADFVRWEGGNLYLKIENGNHTYKEVIITEKQIRDFINKCE